MRRNGVLQGASRISDRFFDWAAKRNPRVVLMVLAVPALATGLVVTVHSGNTLSGLAARYCGATHTNDWTGIYAANKATIGSNPNLIFPGQKLAIKCDDPPQLLKLGSVQPAQSPSSGGSVYGITYGDPNYCGDGDGDGWDVNCSIIHSAPAPNPITQGRTYAGGTYSGGGGFQSCVIARESGGNSQVMNSSGHYGLYQFSASTWAAYGGNPADFGNASVAEQNQIFNNAMATAGGAANWSPYDGC
jgi:hypothetical protein